MSKEQVMVVRMGGRKGLHACLHEKGGKGSMELFNKIMYSRGGGLGGSGLDGGGIAASKRRQRFANETKH